MRRVVPMISSIGTDALVALEDESPDVLFETFPGTDIPVWPMLRWSLARATAEIELGTPDLTRPGSRMQQLRTVLGRAIPNETSSSKIGRPAEHLFVVSGTTYAQTPTGRRNWLVGDHAEALGTRALVLQNAAIPTRSGLMDRPQFPSTFSFSDATFRIDLAARLRRPRRRDDVLLRQIINETGTRLGFDVEPQRLQSIQQLMSYRWNRQGATLREFERLLDRVDPRVVYLQTASYGDRSAVIRMMKDRGIVVAEHQHGWIGPAHAAYNFGAAMFTPELSRSLPDVLLTFGEFWSQSVRTPSKRVAIGKPHLESMNNTTASRAERPRQVLVVSGVAEPEEMSRFTLTVRDALPSEWKVLYRPHPSERATMTSRYPLLHGVPGIEFDVIPDVYESLGRSRGVFGTASTVLYEALALDCLVFVKNSPLAEMYVAEDIFGPRLTDDASIKRAVARIVADEPTTGEGLSNELREAVWKPHATSNFMEWAESSSSPTDQE